MTNRRALVAGGTGLVGRELLDLLGKDDRYSNVTTLARKGAEPRGKVETLVVSFDALETTSLPAADDAFCSLGTTRKKAGSDEAFRTVDFGYVVAFARAARRAGASRFLLVSSLGADPRSRVLYSRVKGEAEAAVRALGFDVVGIVRPSVLAGERDESRPGEAMAIAAGRALSPFMVGPLKRYRPISVRAVAEGLVRLAATATPGVTVLESEQIPA